MVSAYKALICTLAVANTFCTVASFTHSPIHSHTDGGGAILLKVTSAHGHSNHRAMLPPISNNCYYYYYECKVLRWVEPLYFPGKTVSKEKFSVSPSLGRVTARLSPCRLTGCRVTDRSSQAATEHNECLYETLNKDAVSLGVNMLFHTQICL